MNIRNTQTNVFNSNVTIHGTLSGTSINTTGGMQVGVHATTGKVGNCASFDGQNGNGSYNSKLGSTSFGVNVVSNFSLSVWIKPRSFSSFQHIIGAPFQNRLNIGANGTNLTFGLYNGTSYGITAPTVSADTWHHYVFIRDSNMLKLYADGVYIGSVSVAGASFSNGSVFSVGGGEYDEYYFHGDIDEMAYWNVPLTTLQIATLYNGGNGTNYAGSPHVNMVSYWSLNESSGTRYDSHGSNHLSEFPVTLVVPGGTINTSTYTTDCSDAISPAVATVDNYNAVTCYRTTDYNSKPAYAGGETYYATTVKYHIPPYVNTIVVTGAGTATANGTYTRSAGGTTSFVRTIANGSVIEFSEYDGAAEIWYLYGDITTVVDEETGETETTTENLYRLNIVENNVDGVNAYYGVAPVPTCTTTTATDAGRWRIEIDGQYAEANAANVSYPWQATWAGAGSSGGGTVTKMACPAPVAGGSINTAGGAVGVGGSINLSNGGGTITMVGNAGSGGIYPSVAGSINLSAGIGGNGGSINLQGSQDDDEGNKAAGGSINLSAGVADGGAGGSIISTGADSPGGTLNMSGGNESGGSINTSGGNDGVGGSINTSGNENAGGSISTTGGSAGSGGFINTSGNEHGAGGSINLSNGGGSITSVGGDAQAGGSLTMSANDDYAGGSINTAAGGDGNGGYINTSDGGGSIYTAGFLGIAGGSINTGASEDGGAGGSIDTSGGVAGSGGSINTSNGGGSINLSNTGGSINLGSDGNSGGGSINMYGGDEGGAGSINTSYGQANLDMSAPAGMGRAAGYINTSANDTGNGGDINTSGAGGYINTSGSNDGNTPGGYINTSADNERTGGYINTSGYDDTGNGGNINTAGGADGHGGSIDTSNNGGSINTTGTQYDGAGGSINTSGGYDCNGGSINTSGGATNPGESGGSINTSNGGGSIDTRGTGSIALGVTGTRTTLTGSASESNKTIALPNASGTVALVSQTIAFAIALG
jgi:hypothetical protein